MAETKFRYGWYLLLFVGLVISLSWVTAACQTKPPTILAFSATPSEITVGKSTTLKWVVEGATTVRIDQGIGDVAATESIKLSPDRTTAYTLTATNAGGTVSKSVVVYVVAAAAPPTAPDTKSPVITKVSALSETETEVVITWATNEPGTSQVEYGKSTDYGLIANSNGGLATIHSITLSGLEPNTAYHYRVGSKDKAGNEALSVDYTFITLAPKSPYSLELKGLEWGRRTDDTPVFGIQPTIEQKSLFIKGVVRNTSRATLRGVMCTMNCWSGKDLVKFESYVHQSPILPGGSFEFNIETADDLSVDKVTVEFADSLGREIEAARE